MAQTLTPTIVTVNTTVTRAPVPSQLQQSGAAISTGGTTLTAGHWQYVGTPADLTPILAAPLALATLAWSSGTVTATAVAALEYTTGETFLTTIAGALPAGYNGTYTATVTGADTFTFTLTTNPGSETSPGTYTPPGSAFVSDVATTFSAQGQSVGFYVLELGPVTTNAAGIAAFQTWITANTTPQQFYAYLLPKSWDTTESTEINTLAANYESASGQTYFFVTTTAGNLAAYTANKAVFALVPSPTAASTEVQAAAAFYQWLVNNPGASNQLAPMQYRYVYGVTPWAQMGNQTTINGILSAYGNVIITGAEGGISTSCLFKGTTMDGQQSAAWYGLDWFRINAHQQLAAAIINGSNTNPPLLYDQSGINALQAVAQNVGNSAVTFGCANSVIVNAVDFVTYTTQNPDDYAAGIYNGLSATLVTQNGFLTITFNLTATFFAP